MPTKKATQSAFDAISTHLLTQRERSSISNTRCYYRYKKLDGTVLKCAAGAIIPDSLYDPSMEGKVIEDVFYKYRDLRLYLIKVDISMLMEVQRLHDTYSIPIANWEYRLKEIADKYNLKWNHGE